jgi:hypothetical protein
LGVGAIFGYFQRKLDEVYRAAELISLRFEDERIRAKLDELEQRAKAGRTTSSSGPIPGKPQPSSQ